MSSCRGRLENCLGHRGVCCSLCNTFQAYQSLTIDRYADKKALDSHMEIPPVKEVIAYMSSNPVFQGSGPKIHQLSWLEGMDFTKPEVSQQKDLYVVFADIELIAGKRDDTLRYWQGNLDSSSEESGCFVYGFAQDSEKPDHLFSLEAYESESYLWDVHFKAAAVQETIQKTKDLRKNLTLAKLKFHSGFVYKDNASSTT